MKGILENHTVGECGKDGFERDTPGGDPVGCLSDRGGPRTPIRGCFGQGTGPSNETKSVRTEGANGGNQGHGRNGGGWGISKGGNATGKGEHTGAHNAFNEVEYFTVVVKSVQSGLKGVVGVD